MLTGVLECMAGVLLVPLRLPEGLLCVTLVRVGGRRVSVRLVCIRMRGGRMRMSGLRMIVRV